MEEQNRADIEAAQAGDQEAYRRLVHRYEADVSRLMWRFSRDPRVCEELVQDVFVEAFYSLPGYRFEAPFLYWIKRIATRVGYRFWKQRDRRRQFVALDDVPDRAAPASRDTEQQDIAALAFTLLQRLDPADRLVLTLLYFDQCSTDQIAKRMGWSRAMVKMRAYRARAKLRTWVEREKLLENIEWTP